MGTVMDNAGTVLEHIVLSMATRWACGTRPDAFDVGYVDTHAMASANSPVAGGPPPALVSGLLTQAAAGPVGGAAPELARSYVDILPLCAAAQAAGTAACYPSHFIHAARAAHAMNRHLTALLFENDAAAGGRRAEIEQLLAPSTFGLNPTAWAGWTASLAPPPGDFRTPGSWAPVTRIPRDVVVVMSDPIQYQAAGGIGMNMGPADLALIGGHITGAGRVPDVLVHVVFVTSNLGLPAGPGGVHPYNVYTQQIAAQWVGAMVPAGAQSATAGVQWGSFLVFVGAYDKDAPAGAFACTFAQLTGAIPQALDALWPGHNPTIR